MKGIKDMKQSEVKNQNLVFHLALFIPVSRTFLKSTCANKRIRNRTDTNLQLTIFILVHQVSRHASKHICL